MRTDWWMWIGTLLLLGCGSKQDAPAAATTVAISAPTPGASSASAATATASAAGASGEILLEWKARKRAPGTKLDIVLVVGTRQMALGGMDATSDDASSGTPDACEIFAKERTRSSSRFGCGGTPAYHFYTATLRDGALVVTLTEGVESEPGSRKEKEVARLPATGTALNVRPFQPWEPPAAQDRKSPCAEGFFAASEGDCVKECDTDADCKAPKICEDVRWITDDGRIGGLLGRGCQ